MSPHLIAPPAAERPPTPVPPALPHEELAAQLSRLLTGLAAQEIDGGKAFLYDGAALYADEVADLMYASVLCLAQDLSQRLGMGGFGYRFAIGVPAAIGLPLLAEAHAPAKRFLEVAPFVAEVFEGEVMACRHDLARLFEAAARTVHADFCLHKHSNY